MIICSSLYITISEKVSGYSVSLLDDGGDDDEETYRERV